MIFETLSLEYFLAGKSLPWNKHANPDETPAVNIAIKSDRRGPVDPTAHRYFNLKNW